MSAASAPTAAPWTPAVSGPVGAPGPASDESRREVGRLRLLHTLTLELTATLDEEELAPKVLEAATAALDADSGSLWLADGDALTCRLACGPDGDRLVGAQVPSDAAADTDEGAGTTVLSARMVARGATVGMLRASRTLADDAPFGD